MTTFQEQINAMLTGRLEELIAENERDILGELENFQPIGIVGGVAHDWRNASLTDEDLERFKQRWRDAHLIADGFDVPPSLVVHKSAMFVEISDCMLPDHEGCERCVSGVIEFRRRPWRDRLRDAWWEMVGRLRLAWLALRRGEHAVHAGCDEW